MTHARTSRQRAQVIVAFGAFVLLGISASAAGVLLPLQIRDFAVDKTVIGLLFVTFSVGYVTSATANGSLTHWIGTRAFLGTGALAMAVAAGLQALRPAFVVFLVLQLLFGYGTGAIDAGLNAYLSTLDRPTPLLNSLHAFFGAGAIAGPLAATAVVSGLHLSWNVFLGLFAALMVPLVVGIVVFYPAGDVAAHEARPRVVSALRLRAVWLGGAFLAVYVGLEVALGNWGLTFLREDRGQAEFMAGLVMSGYWTGLTLGRFVLARIGERFGLGARGLNAWCLVGVAVGVAMIWLVPWSVAATIGFVLTGFFLGPLFPTMIAVMPRLTPAGLVATAIGILVGLSAVGGALAPALAGAIAQRSGAWSLLPYSLLLAALLGVVWWRIAVRIPGEPLHPDAVDATPTVVQG